MHIHSPQFNIYILRIDTNNLGPSKSNCTQTMAAKSSNQEIVYEEFEPFCKWQRKEDRDVLEIHLQDFKKDQLKVQISNHGVLKISGERALDPLKPSIRTKFYKEVPAPSTKYDSNAIHAKFVDSKLIITLPKPQPQPQLFLSSSSQPDHAPKSSGGAAKEQGPADRGNVQCQMKCRKKPMMGSRMAKMAASLAVTVVAAVVLAAYVHYMYRSTVDDIDD